MSRCQAIDQVRLSESESSHTIVVTVTILTATQFTRHRSKDTLGLSSVMLQSY